MVLPGDWSELNLEAIDAKLLQRIRLEEGKLITAETAGKRKQVRQRQKVLTRLWTQVYTLARRAAAMHKAESKK